MMCKSELAGDAVRNHECACHLRWMVIIIVFFVAGGEGHAPVAAAAAAQ